MIFFMKKRPVVFLVLIFSAKLAAIWPDKASYIGTVQFPKTMQEVPHVRVYFRGNKLVCDANARAHKVTFAVEAEKKQRVRLFLLISSEKITLVKAHKPDPDMEQNTIEHLKLLPDQSYKMYQLDLVKEYLPVENDDMQNNNPSKKQAIYRWLVTQVALAESGRIPDDAIIVRLNADYVACVEGGNGVELPRIKLKDSAIIMAGSEEKLLEEMAQVLFSSLDIDTLHASVRHEKRGDLQLKTIVAMAR